MSPLATNPEAGGTAPADASPDTGPTPRSRVGMWYTTGPADRAHAVGDPGVNLHRVVSDTTAAGCVAVENAAG